MAFTVSGRDGRAIWKPDRRKEQKTLYVLYGLLCWQVGETWEIFLLLSYFSLTMKEMVAGRAYNGDVCVSGDCDSSLYHLISTQGTLICHMGLWMGDAWGKLIGKSSGRWHTYQITEHPRTIGWSLCFIFTPLVLLHVRFSLSFFLRVAWEAVIRYLPKSSWESWSQGWWMNACLRVSIHWEYHLPATLSGTIQTMETVWNSPVLHSMFTFYVIFTTISQCLILVQSTMFEPHTQLNTLVRSWRWLITCLITSESTFATRQETFHESVCLSLDRSVTYCI